ncbi:unnamed protein product [Gordionus sp. m RMFG-2023]|uniref:probable U3 small nucleolar RNA-associated protein 11 n=1 Tax=Gordionus sp. m RMFG-2023 TaxID=3053472 RepID=UPI0030E37663
MSSLDKIAKSFRRIHKERSQPDKRKEFGFLPKKSDYKKRAKNHQRRSKLLKVFKEKAYNKNWDEFYFKMINMKPSKDDEEEIIENKQDKLSYEQSLLIKTQDLNYLKYKRNINLKKIDKLKEENKNDTKSLITHTLFYDKDEPLPKDRSNLLSLYKKDDLNVNQNKKSKQLRKRLLREQNLNLLQKRLENKKDKSKTFNIRAKDGAFITIPERKS